MSDNTKYTIRFSREELFSYLGDELVNRPEVSAVHILDTLDGTNVYYFVTLKAKVRSTVTVVLSNKTLNTRDGLARAWGIYKEMMTND